MRVTTKTDRQVNEYRCMQRRLSSYEREWKIIQKIKDDKRSPAQRQRYFFLAKKSRALRLLLHIPVPL